jgi:hypothetical protein
MQYKDRLTPKPNNWNGEWSGRKSGAYKWYEIQDTVDYFPLFDLPKIVYPVIAKEPRFTYDDSGFYTNDKTFIIPKIDLYLLGILNTKISWLFLKRICSVLGDPDKGGRLELRDIHMKLLPIYQINFDNFTEKTVHDSIVTRVELILALHKERQALDPAAHFDEIRELQRRIQRLEDEIDQHVYQLYGLTEEEIKIVEGK